MAQQIHEKMASLLEKQEPAVRALITSAITMAQTERLSRESLAYKLRTQLPRVLKEGQYADQDS